MSLNYEMARYTELTGEDGTKVPVSRLGGFLDGYEKGRQDAFDEAIAYFEIHAHEVHSHVSARDFICDRLEQLKGQNNG